jgi:hypothetical protein
MQGWHYQQQLEEQQMSMDMCAKCDRPVDTDFDLDCYVDDKCICERCREADEAFDGMFLESMDKLNQLGKGLRK